MPLAETVLILVGLLAVAMVTAGLCRSWPVPYTVLLVIIGLLARQLAGVWAPLAPLRDFGLSPAIVFSIFLPALIFESGFNLDARELMKRLDAVLVLAIPALLASTALIGTGVWLALGVEPITALIFGALISATDPVAVIALFKELGAPRRLTVLVEGEALLNDATAIVVFGILLGIAVEGNALDAGTFGWAFVDFVRVFVGGAAVGVVIGLAVSELAHRLRSSRSAIVTLSIVVAYASFILSEHVLHISGVMAAATSALSLGVFGVARFPREATAAIGETWEFIALVCNSLLFLLLGLSVEPTALGSRVVPVLVAVSLVLSARAAVVYGLAPLTVRLFGASPIARRERHVVWWGGLRGGLAIAIVLSIPNDLSGRDLLLDLTLGVVLFTLLVNAPTIRPLMRWLQLDQMSDDERAELARSVVVARRHAEQDLERFHEAGFVSGASHQAIRETVAATLPPMDPLPGRSSRVREAYIVALRAEFIELERLHELDAIDTYTYFDLRNRLQTDRDIHAANLPAGGEERTRASPFERMEGAVLRRLREGNWATALLSRYQGVRLAQHLQYNIAGILMCEAALQKLRTREDLDEESRRALAATYEERIQRRRGRVETIRVVLPELYGRFESRLFSRVALSSAMHTTERRFQQGEIGAKAFTEIERRLYAALSRVKPLSERPAGRAPVDLCATVPLLAGLSERSLKALADRARPVTFLTGDVVIEEGQRGHALYIIAHGRLGVAQKSTDGTIVALRQMEQGEFFGELALLGDHLRTATVTALAPSTLLRLARRDVMALAVENPEVERRLDQARRERTPEAAAWGAERTHPGPDL